MREDMEEIAVRWMRARRALKAEDQARAEQLSAMIRTHSRDRIAVIEDPLEAAVFALFIELEKELAERE
ncbi:MAG: hypothetical protein HGA40_02610 [Methanoregulaceae archaeon]|jgi:hypothetical protein|nr:hypothetical protein [Methanoregulaceae archaeon]